jgi:hypothetical protein
MNWQQTNEVKDVFFSFLLGMCCGWNERYAHMYATIILSLCFSLSLRCPRRRLINYHSQSPPKTPTFRVAPHPHRSYSAVKAPVWLASSLVVASSSSSPPSSSSSTTTSSGFFLTLSFIHQLVGWLAGFE